MTLISTKDCMRPALPVRTESMKRRADDGRTIHIYIHIYIYTYTIYCAHCCTVYVGLAQARPNKQFAHECLVYVGLAQARPKYKYIYIYSTPLPVSRVFGVRSDQARSDQARSDQARPELY